MIVFFQSIYVLFIIILYFLRLFEKQLIQVQMKVAQFEMSVYFNRIIPFFYFCTQELFFHHCCIISIGKYWIGHQSWQTKEDYKIGHINYTLKIKINESLTCG